jgi:acetyl-CoA carboxylase biotin carboxyl carrier protein
VKLAKEKPKALGMREIKEILDLLKDTDVEEIELEKDNLKIRIKIKKRGPAPVWISRSATPLLPELLGEKAPVSSLPAKEGDVAGNLVTVKSPMVGTFYRAPLPGAEPFVKEGDVVEKGKILCIIEAMKLMNEIESEVSGRIHSILVENVQPVEYGQPLFLMEPL